MRTDPVIATETQKKETAELLEKIKHKVAVALVGISAVGFFFKLLFF